MMTKSKLRQDRPVCRVNCVKRLTMVAIAKNPGLQKLRMIEVRPSRQD
jgi:hypothetical protein